MATGLTEDQLNKIIQAIKDFDSSGIGIISASSLQRILLTSFQGIKDEEVNEIIERTDVDGDGYININEFEVLMKTS